jgi:hypothetical protein
LLGDCRAVPWSIFSWGVTRPQVCLGHGPLCHGSSWLSLDHWSSLRFCSPWNTGSLQSVDLQGGL